MTDSSPLVSIVMPNYNNEKFLPDALNSIQRQTLDDYELVICHDPSEDNSLQVLQDFSSRDQRINLILGKEKTNAAHGYNVAIDNARGKYIFVMDSDNIMAPELLQKSVDFMTANPGITILNSNLKIFGKFEHMVKRAARHHDLILAKLLKGFYIHNSFMTRREFFDQTGLRYDENLRIAFDHKLIIEAMLQNEYPVKFAIMDYLGIHYRMHDSNLNRSKETICVEMLDICDFVSKKLYPQDSDYKMLRNVMRYHMNHVHMRSYDCGIDTSYVTLKNMLIWRDETIAGLSKYQALDGQLMRSELNRGIFRMIRRQLKAWLISGYHVRQSVA